KTREHYLLFYEGALTHFFTSRCALLVRIHSSSSASGGTSVASAHHQGLCLPSPGFRNALIRSARLARFSWSKLKRRSAPRSTIKLRSAGPLARITDRKSFAVPWFAFVAFVAASASSALRATSPSH